MCMLILVKQFTKQYVQIDPTNVKNKKKKKQASLTQLVKIKILTMTITGCEIGINKCFILSVNTHYVNKK